MSKENNYSATKSRVTAPLEVYWLIELQLLALSFSTGIQDAIAFPDFHCFASNQTGNTVVLAVGLSGAGGEIFNLKNVSVSLAAFLLGAWTTGVLGRYFGPRSRHWLFTTHLMQTVMAFGAATIQEIHGVTESGPFALGAISLLAFSSGAQVASMRAFAIGEITTAMATAAWVDLLIDSALFKLKNRSRNRRVLFLAALVSGSFAGAYLRLGIGSAHTLLIAAAGKFVVTVSFLLNRVEAGAEPVSSSNLTSDCAQIV